MKFKILLPAGWRTWSQAKRDAVLAHERAHICRRDPAIALLARLNRCLFWFHPLAWWLEYKLGLWPSKPATYPVLSGNIDRHEYVQVLLEMAAAVGKSKGRVYSYSLELIIRS